MGRKKILLAIASVALGMAFLAVGYYFYFSKSGNQGQLTDMISQQDSSAPVLIDNIAGSEIDVNFKDGPVLSSSDYGFKINFSKQIPEKYKSIIYKVTENSCKDCAIVTIVLPTADKEWPAVLDEKGNSLAGYAEYFNVIVADLDSWAKMEDAEICKKVFSDNCPEQGMIINKSDRYVYALAMPKSFPADLQQFNPGERALDIAKANFELVK